MNRSTRPVLGLLFTLATFAARAQTPAELAQLRDETIARINVVRTAAGVPPVVLDEELSRGAQEHALYLVANRVGPRDEVHTQNPRLPGATDAGARAGEAAVIMLQVAPHNTVAFHLSSLFHRLPLVNPGLRRVGVGAARSDLWGWASVLDVQTGVETVRWTAPVWVPAANATNVPTTFGLAGPNLVVTESPNPLGSRTTAGYPITVSFPPGTRISSPSAELTGPKGSVPISVYHPDGPPTGMNVENPGLYMQTSIAVIPQLPLSPTTTYRVRLRAHLDGAVDFDETISFTTGNGAFAPEFVPKGAAATTTTAPPPAAVVEPAHAYWFEPFHGSELYGLMDERGRELLSPRFAWVSRFSEGRAIVNQGGENTDPLTPDRTDVVGGSWGVVSTSGAIVVAPRYQMMREYREGRAGYQVNGKWGFLDPSGGEVILAAFEAVGDFANGLAPVKRNGKWGFVDVSGTLIVPHAYELVYPFGLEPPGLAPVRVGGLWGFIDRSNTMRIPARYADTNGFSDGVAAVRTGDRWGLISPTGAQVLAPTWDWIYASVKSRLRVVKGEQMGLIDTTGRVVVAPTYREIYPMEHGAFRVEGPGYAEALMDADGRLLTEWLTGSVSGFTNGPENLSSAHELDRRGGFVNTDGAWVLSSPSWHGIEPFDGPLARVYIDRADQIIALDGSVLWMGERDSVALPDDASGVSDGLVVTNRVWSRERQIRDPAKAVRTDGSVAFEAPYDVKPFREGRARFLSDRKWGYLDTAGKVAVPARYADAADYTQGLAAVKVGSMWGYIDTTGREVIAPAWDRARPFVNGRAIVRRGTRTALIDTRGAVVVALGARLLESEPLGESGESAWYPARDPATGLAGYMDRDGTWKITPRYQDAKPFRDGRAPVRLKDRYGFIDARGVMVIPAAYTAAEPFSEGYAQVQDGPGCWGLVDLAGKVAVPTEFSAVRPVRHGQIWLLVDSMVPTWGLAATDGDWILPPIYDRVLDVFRGGAVVQIFDSIVEAYIDRSGRVVRQY